MVEQRDGERGGQQVGNGHQPRPFRIGLNPHSSTAINKEVDAESIQPIAADSTSFPAKTDQLNSSAPPFSFLAPRRGVVNGASNSHTLNLFALVVDGNTRPFSYSNASAGFFTIHRS
uniref:Uncharacterized protein n=1 Tax=Plectus sambesii TaxID=2011161 RepID=A0A914XA85_9BILA